MELMRKDDIRAFAEGGMKSYQLPFPENSVGKSTIERVVAQPGATNLRHKPRCSELVWAAFQFIPRGGAMLVRAFAIATLLALPSHSLFAQVISRAGVYKIGVSKTSGAGSVGSAVLIAPGKLVTNCHTLRDAKHIALIYPEGQLSASLEQADSFHDLCLLGAPAFTGRPPTRVPSAELAVGQPVIAIGFGRGFDVNVSRGSITALYRYDDSFVLRTSAWFPKGASGGGLFDEEGRLLGILSFRGSASDELNYALPNEWIDRILMERGSSQAPTLSSTAFWEDDTPQQPTFLRAARMEYQGAWRELHVLATEWLISSEDDAEAWIALGRASVALGQNKGAAVALRRAVTLQPNNSRAWYWLATAYRSLGYDRQFADASGKLGELDTVLATRLRSVVDDSVQSDFHE
jgi:serine protease Do